MAVAHVQDRMRRLISCILFDMPIPVAPEDRNLPKGPNFLGIVIGSALALLLILLAAWVFLSHRKTVIPMNTRETPSQTYSQPPRLPRSPRISQQNA